MVASTALVKTLVNQRGNIPIVRTNTNKQNIRRAKNKERKNKNRTKAIELPRLNSSLNFSLWAIKGPGARFSKVPKLFGPISCDRIVFVSSKRRRLEARNFAAIFIFIPFTISGTFEKRAPGVFFFWLMAYPQPIGSMAYNLWP